MKQEKTKEENKKENKLHEEIDVPEGISTELDNNFLIMKKDNKLIKRKLNPLINLKIEGKKIVMTSKRARKTEKRLFGTFRAHIKNMIKGLIDEFTYKLQVSNVHFPMSVSYDKPKNELVVKNFLGEAKERRIKLIPNVDIKIDKEIIEISSFDIEKAGIAATIIEKGTRVKNKDRRIYQDGIFIVQKPKISYL